MSGISSIPQPINDPVRTYLPGSTERQSIKKTLAAMSSEKIDIPLLIGGKEIRTGDTETQVMPHKHRHVLATWHKAGRKEVEMAVQAAKEAHREWSGWKFEDRAAVFLEESPRHQIADQFVFGEQPVQRLKQLLDRLLLEIHKNAFDDDYDRTTTTGERPELVFHRLGREVDRDALQFVRRI